MKQIVVILLIVILSGCGTTQVVAYNSNVDIYINNQFKGKGEATISRTGPPQKSHIEAKHNGTLVGSTDIRRKVKFVTVVVGIYTYGLGFFLTWRYPETVIVPINDFQEKKGFDQRESIWDLPPGEWRK